MGSVNLQWAAAHSGYTEKSEPIAQPGRWVIVSAAHSEVSFQQALASLWNARMPTKREEKMGNIRVSGYRLKREITVFVYEKNGEFYADYNDLNLLGVGDTEEEACRDLGELISEVYESLANVPDENLSAPLVADKQFVSGLVERI